MSADLTQSEDKDEIAAATQQSDTEPMEVQGEIGDHKMDTAAPPAGSEESATERMDVQPVASMVHTDP